MPAEFEEVLFVCFGRETGANICGTTFALHQLCLRGSKVQASGPQVSRPNGHVFQPAALGALTLSQAVGPPVNGGQSDSSLGPREDVPGQSARLRGPAMCLDAKRAQETLATDYGCYNTPA